MHRTAFVLCAMLCLVRASTADAERKVQLWISAEDESQLLAPAAPLPMSKAAIPSDLPTVEVDPSQRFQTILGMGSSLEHTTCYNLSQLGPQRMAEAIERLVDPATGIGMNLMRICIGTPDFTGEPWYSYDDMPPGKTDVKLEHFSIEKDQAYVLPVLKKALEKNPDLLFYASPWSPPGWMKSTEDMIGGYLLPRFYKVYAQYFVKFIEAYQAEGIPIYAITPQNEPGVNTRNYPVSDWYPSCQWSLVEDEDTYWPVSHEEMGCNERDFIKKYLGPALAESGQKTQIWCYDHNLNNPWYPRNILKDPDAAQYVAGTGFHGYAGNPKEMSAFHDEFPQKPVYFTEGSAPGVKGAMRILSYFRNWASSYNAWVIMIDYDGHPNNGPFKTKRTCIQPRRDGSGVDYHYAYYAYGQFMKFVKRGAVRIASTEGSKKLNTVAFENPNGDLVLVAVNADKEPAQFRVAEGGEAFVATLPARSVLTCRWPGR